MRYHLWIAQEKCKMPEQECAKLRAKLAADDARRLLLAAIERMDRARAILRKDENSNWAMLDTQDIKDHLARSGK